jgi:uncharacterized protein (TIGR00369 family)
MCPQPSWPETTGFDRLYGLELLELGADRVRGQVRVGEEHKRFDGLVHPGVYAALAESLASIGTATAVADETKVATGLASQTSFLQTITEGVLYAAAVPRHRGRTTWVWEVTISDDHGALCGLTRITIAIREAPTG